MPRGIPRWLEAGTSSHFSYAATPPRISIQSTSTLTAVMDIYAEEGIARTYRIGNFRPVLRECLRTAMGGRVPRGKPKKLAPGWVGDYHVAAQTRSPQCHHRRSRHARRARPTRRADMVARCTRRRRPTHSGRSSNRCCLRRAARQAAVDDPRSIAAVR